MAAEVSLPKIGAKAWSSLRARAASAPSTKFVPTTVAAMLSMANPKSASDNVVWPLRTFGLINEDGSLTTRGNKWRVDSSYAAACEEILSEVYPAELQSFTDQGGRPDRAQITAWLQHRGQGESNAKQMAATYVMVVSRDLPAPPESIPSDGKKKASGPKARSKAVVPANQKTGEELEPSGQDQSSEKQIQGAGPSPSIHLDIQVHIPPAASAEEIDQIFASMAKHLYRS